MWVVGHPDAVLGLHPRENRVGRWLKRQIVLIDGLRALWDTGAVETAETQRLQRRREKERDEGTQSEAILADVGGAWGGACFFFWL
jgi:hypothetical protein